LQGRRDSATAQTGAIEVDRTLEGMREIAVDRAVQRGVRSAMRELADGGSRGAHRLPLTDLTVAVAAQTSGLGVLQERNDQRGSVAEDSPDCSESSCVTPSPSRLM
jgi:hypothetical protein